MAAEGPFVIGRLFARMVLVVVVVMGIAVPQNGSSWLMQGAKIDNAVRIQCLNRSCDKIHVSDKCQH